MTIPTTTRRLGAAASLVAVLLPFAAHADGDRGYIRAAVPEGAIEHILVINLENESENVTFGGCPATPLPATPTI